MICRKVDANGDILPVLVPEDMASGTDAVAIGLKDHLQMFTGEWWEYRERGNGIFDMIAGERITEKQVPTLCSYLSSYVLNFPEIEQVSDVLGSITEGQFHYSSVVHMKTGEEVKVSF